jgi:DNA invertase Pin-like site-specific DNA recombinase
MIKNFNDFINESSGLDINKIPKNKNILVCYSTPNQIQQINDFAARNQYEVVMYDDNDNSRGINNMKQMLDDRKGIIIVCNDIDDVNAAITSRATVVKM